VRGAGRRGAGCGVMRRGAARCGARDNAVRARGGARDWAR